MNSQLGLDQRLFSARPDALPIQATPSYYNPATPTKAAGNRGHTSSLLRDETFSGSARSDYPADSPSRTKPVHRPRTLTSVSLSPSGKLLAVGEQTGYHPRILVYSTEYPTSTDAPIACLTEHTFGVRALAFSHDSRWLCSLGDLHDGGLFLWSINPRTGAPRLDSSNRCTTAETIAWMGESIVSVGNRNVKIWRTERPSSPSKLRRGLDGVGDGSTASPIPRTFSGRNCLLGTLKDSRFTCVVGISEDRAILGTQDGVVCLLNDANRSQHLYQVSKKNYSITCITLDRSSGIVWLGGSSMGPEALPLDALLTAENLSIPLERQKMNVIKNKFNIEGTSNDLALCCADNRLIAANSGCCMRIYDVSPNPGDAPVLTSIQAFPGHDSTIQGVVIMSEINDTQSDFLTYSTNGLVLHWSLAGTCTCRFLVHLNQPLDRSSQDSNELRVVRVAPTITKLLAGDKAGYLHLLSTSGEAIATFKAHEGEVFDLALHNSDGTGVVAASCGRDRTIQTFLVSEDKCSLQQSIVSEHGGPVRKVAFVDGGNLLSSMSSDRTVVIYRKVPKTDGTVAFISTKVIDLKASPIAMSALSDLTPTLIISATDRCIRRIAMPRGNIIHTFKTSDDGEPVTLSRLSKVDLTWESKCISALVGFSPVDRSIRLYNLETGLLLAVEYGQNVVGDLASVKVPEHNGEDHSKIVSIGFDGTILIWRIMQKNTRTVGANRALDQDPAKPQLSSMQRPVRRVLSKAELTEYQRSLGMQTGEATMAQRKLSPSPLRRKTSRHAIPDKPPFPPPSLSHKIRSSHAAIDGKPRQSKSSNSRLRPKRLSLNDGHRDTTSHYPRTVSAAARHLVDVLQDFRNLFTISKDRLGSDAAQALQKELHETSKILAQKSTKGDSNENEQCGESFDDFLTKLVDDRLAIRFRSDEHANASAGDGDNDPSPPGSTSRD
ncbi:MAG: hypothetical protein Q9219_005977 [cf. Caloplaca sp. 3 TL-2023]